MPNNDLVAALIELITYSLSPHKNVPVGEMSSALLQIQLVFQRERAPGLGIGSDVVSLLIPSIFSKDPRFALALESERQRNEVRAPAELLAFLNKTAADAALATASKKNVMAFAAAAAPVVAERQQYRSPAPSQDQLARAAGKKNQPCFDLQRGLCNRGDQCAFSHDPKVIANAPPPPEYGQRLSTRSARGDKDGVCAGCSKPGHGLQTCPVFKIVPHATQSAPVARLASAAAPVEIGRDRLYEAVLGNYELSEES
jgi:hypothetical protein